MNSNLKQLLAEYERNRNIAIEEANFRKKELYARNPRLQEIESTLSKEAIRTSKLLISSKEPSLLESLNNTIDALKNEKFAILEKLGVACDYLRPTFHCNFCEDTGYLQKESSYEMCSCLKQKLFDLEYNKSNIFNLKNDNFDNFNFAFYSDVVDENKFHSNISPRENINKIKELSFSFIDNFDNFEEKNLLFTGNTGLGKSFLSSCIANELLKKGKTVLYQTAPVMLDTIIDYRFNKPNVPAGIYQNLLNVDLLIIDDLGTESMNNMKFTELFNILNTRLLNFNNKITKTIISTNLSLQNLFDAYGERIFSRIIGSYSTCYFYGEDLRIKKNINKR